MKNLQKPIFYALLIIFLLSSNLFGELLFDKSEYAARRKNLMHKIPDGMAVILGAQKTLGYYKYFQNNDFVYFSGVEIPNAILLINGIRKESILFFTITEREARGEGISVDLVKNPKKVTGIENVFPLEQFSSYLNRLSSQADVFYTSFKSEELIRECTNEKFRTLQKNMVFNKWDGRLTRELQFVKHLKERFPQVEVKDCSEMIQDLRMIKSPAEIELLRKVGRIGVKAHIEMMKATRPGIYEYELASLFEYICKKEGAQDLSYYVIISSAENHPYLHYCKYDRLLQDGDFLVTDAGPDYGYYDVDISHSYPANGKFSPRQREIYEACLAVQKSCMDLYRPGITCNEVREKVKEIMKQKGYDLSKDIFKQRSMQGGCSHFVGMAVHDAGGSPRGPLKPGMVFACDIFAVFPKEDLGVRIEDTVVITENGCENLTKGVPREIDEIESFMKKKGIIQILKEKKIY